LLSGVVVVLTVQFSKIVFMLKISAWMGFSFRTDLFNFFVSLGCLAFGMDVNTNPEQPSKQPLKEQQKFLGE
jgi:hypothetical protein